MVGSDVTVVWKNTTNGLTISDRHGVSHSVPVFDKTQDSRLLSPSEQAKFESLLQPKYNWTNIYVSFRRPLQAMNSSEDNPIETSTNQTFIFAGGAYGPYDGIDYMDMSFSAHLSNNKGVFSYDFFEGYRAKFNFTPEVKLDLGNLSAPGFEPIDGKLFDPNVRSGVNGSVAGVATFSPLPPLPSFSPSPSSSPGSSVGGEISGAGSVSVKSSGSIAESVNGSTKSFKYDKNNIILAHMWLMIVAWGFFAPISMLISVFKRRFGKNAALYVYLTAGMTLILTATAFAMISAVTESPHFSGSLHQTVGIYLVCLIPFAMLINIKYWKISTKKRSCHPLRVVGRFIQKFVPYLVVLLFVAEIGVALYEYIETKWMILYGVYVVFWILLFIIFWAFAIYDRMRNNSSEDEDTDLLDDGDSSVHVKDSASKRESQAPSDVVEIEYPYNFTHFNRDNDRYDDYIELYRDRS
ncbi:hypothetical protein HK098_001503 [Nowakowskiella sp. JEL0407]|nr:hypothetical protein HK098_001503 [Nowakowskiella sp. JEL0407]